MKIDELIEELEKIREKHGNLSVVIPFMQAGTIQEIKVGDLEIDLIGELNVKEHGLY